MFYNTAFSDILRYIRQWTFLLFVFIYETFRKKDVINSFKIIYYITLFISIPIIFQVVSEVEIFGDILKDSESRGIKAPSYSIFCAVLAIVNIWNLSRLSRYVHSVIFILPIMLNLKMTYAISVLLIYLLYLLFDSKFSYFRKVIAIMILVFFTSVFLITSDKFTERFLKMTTEVSSFQKKEVEGNFSYRLMHAYERFVYISKDHFYFIRGIGYVSELNFNKNVFVFGQPDYRTGKKAQLDTADIAWSLFFVRFGFLGLFLYLLLYIKIIEQYYKNRKRNKFNLSFFCMLTVFLIFTSIGNTIIAISDFFIFPILFLNQKTLSAGSLKSYILVIKKKNENNTSGF